MQSTSRYGCDLPAPGDNDYPHFHARWLEEIGDDRIAAIDFEESGGDAEEVREFGLSALSRVEQALILESLEVGLMPVKTIQRHAPSSYRLKHAAENILRDTMPYVSNLQVRTCMRIIGYRHTDDGHYPRYNVSLKSWHRYEARASLGRCGVTYPGVAPRRGKVFAGKAVV